MIIRGFALIIVAVCLSACTVNLEKDGIVLTDRALAANHVTLPDYPTKSAKLEDGARLITENLSTDFGTLHTVRIDSGTSRPLVVFCGGNTFREENQGAKAVEVLTRLGDPLLFDYPGYGASQGTGSRADFDAAEKVLLPRLETLGAGREVLFIGHSLGGGVCANLAAKTHLPSGLVLAATFGRYSDIKDDLLGWFRGAVDVKPADDLIAYDAPALLKDYPGPVVVMALTEDEVIAYKVSRRLADDLRQSGRRVRFVTLTGGGHGKILGHPEFQAALTAALKDLEAPAQP